MDEAKKYFAPGSKRYPEVGAAAKDMALADVDGVNEEIRHVVSACFLGPPCRAICIGPHSNIQLCPEGLARADALGLFVSLQRPRFLRRLSA